VRDTWRRLLWLNILVNGFAGAIYLAEDGPLYGALLLPLAALQGVAAFWALPRGKQPLLRLTIVATLLVEVVVLGLRPDSGNPSSALGAILGLLVVGLGVVTLRQLSGRSARLIAEALPSDMDPAIGSPPAPSARGWAHEVRDLLRFEPTRLLATPGALITSIAFSFGIIWLTWNLIYYKDDIIGVHEDARLSMVMELIQAFFRSELLDVLQRDVFPLQLLLMAGLVLMTPLLAMLLAADQTANDTHNRNARFILQRFSRRALYGGRALGGALSWLAQVSALTLLCSLALGFADPKGFDAHHVTYALWTAAVVSLYAVPFVALMAAFNAAVGRAMVAFSMGIGFWILVLLGDGAWLVMMHAEEEAFGPAGVLFPTAFKYWLLSADTGKVASALGVFAAQSVLYLSVGWVLFKRRDV
jgi:ABC-type transport system involved in multi-copper enzyme maturation permease subunit